jgi:hypothetical protein
MYIAARIGKLSIAMATKDEYVIQVTKEKLLCKKGFRLMLGKYIWNKGFYNYLNTNGIANK